MSTIGSRVKAIREQADDGRKLTLVEFGKRISLSNQAISAIETGRIKPSGQTIDLICREFNISRAWLETGEGEMKKPPLDEVAQLLSDVLDKGSEDPLYGWFLSVIKTYQKLDVKDRAIVMRFIEETISAQLPNTTK